jgi:hypothetical protein
VEADRPVGLELNELGQDDLLAEVPVEELGVERRHHVAQLERLVAPQPRDEVDDPQRGERVAAARQLRRGDLRVGHSLGRLAGQWRTHRARIGQFATRSPVSIGTPTSEPYSVHEPS